MLATRERASRFIHVNDTGKPGLVCNAFHALSYYIGCPYKCTYCYLQGTFRGRVNPVLYTNREKLLRELDEWLEQPGSLRLNAGELQDSLALDGIIPLVDDLVPRFASQQRHKLLLVTKATNTRNLLKHNPNGQVVVAFSVNAPEVSQRYEVRAPHPLERVKAAAAVKEAGYYVTLRLDPMVPIVAWQHAYIEFIKHASDIVQPDQWTLGSIRHFGNVRTWAKKVGRDTSIFDLAGEYTPTDRRRRVPETIRLEMYGLAMKTIQATDSRAKVRLCKETVQIHETLNTGQRECCYLTAMEKVFR
jgi:spore photoproduct lyase